MSTEETLRHAPEAVAPVDEMLPGNKLFVFGLQHVLVMYAGAIAVPILIGGAAKLTTEQIDVLARWIDDLQTA